VISTVIPKQVNTFRLFAFTVMMCLPALIESGGMLSWDYFRAIITVH